MHVCVCQYCRCFLSWQLWKHHVDYLTFSLLNMVIHNEHKVHHHYSVGAILLWLDVWKSSLRAKLLIALYLQKEGDCFKINVANSMTNNTSSVCDDFQSVICQSKQDGTICRSPDHSQMSNRSQKAARVKQYVEMLVVPAPPVACLWV